jgi:hypothetical protein
MKAFPLKCRSPAAPVPGLRLRGYTSFAICASNCQEIR